MNVTFRPITPEDHPFLSALYASTRQDEMALVNWTAEEAAAFLQMQFELQHTHYQAHYPTADFLVIELEGTPIGRLYLDRWEREFRLMDIALVPAYRNKGLGSQLLQAVMAEAAGAGLPVRIHDRAGLGVVDEHRVARELEDGAIALLGVACSGHGAARACTAAHLRDCSGGRRTSGLNPT